MFKVCHSTSATSCKRVKLCSFPVHLFISYILDFGCFKEIKWIFFSFFFRLAYLHSWKLIHGNVKPENMLLDRNFKLKITDFGTTNVEISSATELKAISYMAPEVNFLLCQLVKFI